MFSLLGVKKIDKATNVILTINSYWHVAMVYYGLAVSCYFASAGLNRGLSIVSFNIHNAMIVQDSMQLTIIAPDRSQIRIPITSNVMKMIAFCASSK